MSSIQNNEYTWNEKLESKSHCKFYYRVFQNCLYVQRGKALLKAAAKFIKDLGKHNLTFPQTGHQYKSLTLLTLALKKGKRYPKYGWFCNLTAASFCVFLQTQNLHWFFFHIHRIWYDLQINLGHSIKYFMIWRALGELWISSVLLGNALIVVRNCRSLVF